MRWVEWIIQEPLAQMTFLAAVFAAVFLFLLGRKIVTRGKRPATRNLLYAALACFMFAAPCTYFWYQIIHRQLPPSGPLLHSVPSATLHTVDGQEIPLESLRGKVVLLDFWASWCAPCRLSSPAVAEMQKQYGARLVTIGISVDETKEDFRKGLVGARPQYDVYDEGQNLRWTFRVGPLPHFVVLNRAGAVDAIETGWDPVSVTQLHEALERNLAQR